MDDFQKSLNDKLRMTIETSIAKEASKFSNTQKLLFEKIKSELQTINKELSITFKDRIKYEVMCLKFEFEYAKVFNNNKVQNINNTLNNIQDEHFVELAKVIDNETKFKNYMNKKIKAATTNVGKEWASKFCQPAVISNIDLMIKRLGNVKTYSYTHNSCYKDFCTERQKNLKIAKEIVLDKFNNLKKKDILEKKNTRTLI